MNESTKIATAVHCGFAEAVKCELVDARSAHAKINSAHEGYAVILEELEEFWEEVRKRKDKRSSERMLSELIQVGAMAQRIAEDCLLKPETTTKER